MTSTSVTQLFVLGKFAAAKGKLGPMRSKATGAQMTIATGIIMSRDSYGKVGTTVICVEDRLHRLDPRLAGGALSLALMCNFLRGGALLSTDLRKLKTRGFRLAFHQGCGALGLVAKGFVSAELSNVNAEGYKLLGAMGYDVPMAIRQRIALWAGRLPASYVDMEVALKLADDIDDVEGEHNAVAASVSMEDGVSFTSGPRLKRETNGLLSFAFDPWVAKRSAQRISDSRDDQDAAEALALVFTAQILLTLGGPDLWVAIHR